MKKILKWYQDATELLNMRQKNEWDKFKKFDNAIKVDFENDIKNTIKTAVDKIIKD